MIVKKRILILAALTLLALPACNDDGGSEGETTDVIDSVNNDSEDDGNATPDSGDTDDPDSQTEPDSQTDTTDGSPSTPPGTPNVQYSYTSGGSSEEYKEAWIPSGDAPEGYTSVELGSFECEQNGSDLTIIVTATDGTSEIGRMEFDVKNTVETDIKAQTLQFVTSASNSGFPSDYEVYCYESIGIGDQPDGIPNDMQCEAYGDGDDEYLDISLNFNVEDDCNGLEPASWQCVDSGTSVSCDEFGRGTTCEDINGCVSADSCIVQDASYCEAFPSAQGCFNASDSNCNWIFANNRCEQTQPMSPAECDTSDRTTCLNSGCQWLGDQPCTGTTSCGDLSNNRTLCRYAADCEVAPAEEGPIQVIR
jgi:hypothetical protein